MFGEIAAESARAGHTMERADEMPRDRVQPRALREFAFDIRYHRLEHVPHGRMRRRLAVGKLVERSVPALVVPHGQMKTNLLGMSFLDRMESWEVRADRLMLRGYP